MKKIIIFYYLYLCSFVALSQNLDDAYSLLGKENYDSAILVSRLVSEKTSNTNTKGDALYLIAYCYQVSHDYSEAVNYYLQAEKSYTIDKCKARANGNIGAIYRNTGLYKEAIDHQTQAIKLWANEVSKGNSLIDRAIAYKHKALHDLAIVDGLEALRIGYINNNEKLQIRALNQLGLIQKDIEDFGEATVYFKKANTLDLNKKAYLNLGKVYELKKDTATAIDYYGKTLASTKNIEYRFKAYQNLGEIYLSRGLYKLAISHLSKALEIFPKLQFQEVEDIDVYKTLASCYKMQNKLQATPILMEGYDLQTKLLMEREKLINKYKKESILKAKQDFQNELVKNEEHKRQNLILYFVIAFVLILLITILVINIIHKKKRKKEEKTAIKYKKALKEVSEKLKSI